MTVRRSVYPKSAKSPKVNLLKQFAQVLAKIQDIHKVKGDRFHYLQILDIANAVRDELLSRGILLIPNDVAWWREAWMQDGRVVTQYHVETEFELTDGWNKRLWRSFGSGQDMDGHACAIAQTAAIKAWLKRVGFIFGEQDDPEKEQRSIDKPLYPREVGKILERQKRALDAAMSFSGLNVEDVEAIVSKRLEQSITIECIPELPKKLFDFAIKVICGERDMTADLEQSVRATKNGKGKPQPVISILDNAAGD